MIPLVRYDCIDCKNEFWVRSKICMYSEENKQGRILYWCSCPVCDMNCLPADEQPFATRKELLELHHAIAAELMSDLDATRSNIPSTRQVPGKS